MANYEQMSDFDINKRVYFHALGGMFEVLVNHCVPDYCNSWADAGPIIEEYGIPLCFRAIYNRWEACTCTNAGYVYYNIYDNNPLRAAMILFLKMKDAEENDEY